MVPVYQGVTEDFWSYDPFSVGEASLDLEADLEPKGKSPLEMSSHIGFFQCVTHTVSFFYVCD